MTVFPAGACGGDRLVGQLQHMHVRAGDVSWALAGVLVDDFEDSQSGAQVACIKLCVVKKNEALVTEINPQVKPEDRELSRCYFDVKQFSDSPSIAVENTVIGMRLNVLHAWEILN